MTINLHGRRFTLKTNTAGNARPGETTFEFEQDEAAIRASYSGGGVVLGSIVGRHLEDDRLEVLFEQVTTEGKLTGGRGSIQIERTECGKLRFIDDWEFLINGEGGGRAVWVEL